MAVKSNDTRTWGMLTYARFVLDLAWKHGGWGWLKYDKTFRKQMAHNTGYTWGELNPSLLAYSILGADNGGQGRKGMWCTLCQEPNHNTAECALQSLEPASTTPSPLMSRPPGSIGQTGKTNKWRFDPSEDIRRKYNIPPMCKCGYSMGQKKFTFCLNEMILIRSVLQLEL